MPGSFAELWGVFVRRQDQQSWDEVVRALRPSFARVIYRVSRKWGISSPFLLEDALQEAFLKLTLQRNRLPALLSSLSEEAIENYLKALAANSTHDHWKSQRNEPTVANRDDGFDLHILVDAHERLDRTLLMADIDQLLGDDDRSRTIFWLYYRQGFTAREIACIPAFNLSVKGVESLIFRMTELVRQGLHKTTARKI